MTNGFQTYDQWKTASPYDDIDDTHCAYCGAFLPDDVTGFSTDDEAAIMDGYCNVDCMARGANGGVSPRWGLPHLTAEQDERRKAIHNRIAHDISPKISVNNPAPVTLKSVLEFLPDGDFHWRGDDPGDAHAYQCGESGCDIQWHLMFHSIEFKREGDVLTITAHSGDESGWEIDAEWETGDDWEGSEIAYHLGAHPFVEYFLRWAEYWLDAAETGKDPCDQIAYTVTPSAWANVCLDGAEENANAAAKLLKVTVCDHLIAINDGNDPPECVHCGDIMDIT